MNRAWNEFVEADGQGSHAVQIYRDVSELAGPVAEFLSEGFAAGDPGLVVATAAHWPRFAHELERRGWEPASLEEAGMLVVADAHETLAAFTEDARLSLDLFQTTVGGLLDELSDRRPGRQVRAFGEMVNVLYEQGHTASAIGLEELWNHLARTRRFTLMCGYRADPFDKTAQRHLLPDVCRTHSHVFPAADAGRFEGAVDSALAEILGDTQAGKVYSLAAESAGTRAPLPQSALMWVSENMPTFADRILALARTRYADASRPAGA